MTRRLVLPFFALLFLFPLLGCNKAGEAKKEEKQDIKTYKVTSTELQTYIEATGSVQPDLEGTAKIVSHLAGAVNKIYVKVGDRVSKGQSLVSITSPEITDTYSNYLSTLTQLRQADRIYNLNKQLFDIGAVTKNDLLNSEASYNQLNAVADGLRNKLAIYGCSTDEEGLRKNRGFTDKVTIKAPLNGYIADIQTHIGDRVDSSAPLMIVADPQNIMIVANIYDTDVPKIRKGSKITFIVDVWPDITFNGVINYISDVSDTDSKTVKTFIKMLDRKDLLKQNMFLKVKIEGEKKLLPLIPQSAMVYREGKFYVYCPNGSTQKCELKEIKPVREVPGKLMAVEGIREGEEIVLTAIELEKP